MYRISKQFTFSASHILDHLPEGHPCSRIHGHNYRVTVHLKSETLDEFGFVKDYKSLHCVRSFIDETLDHRHLNDCMAAPPTSENLARYLYEHFKPVIRELYAIEVSETEHTTCVYEPAC